MTFREFIKLILMVPLILIFWCLFGIELLFYPYVWLINKIDGSKDLSFKEWIWLVKEFPDG